MKTTRARRSTWLDFHCKFFVIHWILFAVMTELYSALGIKDRLFEFSVYLSDWLVVFIEGISSWLFDEV